MNLHELITSMQGAWYEPLGAFIILLFTSYGIGFALLKQLKANSNRGGFGFLSLILGLDLLSIIFRLGDCAVISLPPEVLYGVVALPAVYGVYSLTGQMRKFHREEWILWSVVLLLGAIVIAPAFLPPYSWDEQSYQVSLVYRYLRQGSTAVLADNPYSALSSMPHFLMLWGVKLGGLNFPRMLTLGSYLLILPWIYLLLRRFGRIPALILVAAFMLSPLTGGMSPEVYLESFILLNLLAGAEAIRLFRSGLGKLAILTGFFAGMAVAVKLTGGAAALALAGLFFCVLAFDRVPRRRTGLVLFYFAFAGLFAVTPFYLRAYQSTGNPFYPFGSALLDPATPAAAVELYHSLLGTDRFGLTGVASVFTSWIVAAYRMEIYDGYLLGWQFPLLIVIGAVGWYYAARRNFRRMLPFGWAILGGFLGYIFWCLSSQQTRFLLPGYFLVLFWGGSALFFYPRCQRKWLLGAIAATTLLSFQTGMGKNFYYAWRSLEAGRKTPEEFVRFGSREREYMNLLDFIAKATPAQSKIMLVFDRRGLYIPRDYVLATPFFQEKFFTPIPDSASAVYDQLRQNKIDYIAILIGGESKRNPDPISEFDNENEALTLRLLELVKIGKLQFVPVAESGRYRLLKVVY
ncbi:MAG: hypothetical protein LBM70_04720 [Victivallales bacterium]|jgi:hypothetical protein|nr:hypothetical protein [Victivallales bacterium]